MNPTQVKKRQVFKQAINEELLGNGKAEDPAPEPKLATADLLGCTQQELTNGVFCVDFTIRNLQTQEASKTCIDLIPLLSKIKQALKTFEKPA